MAGLPAACRSLLSVGTQGAHASAGLTSELLQSIQSYTVCSEQITSQRKAISKESLSRAQNTQRSRSSHKVQLGELRLADRLGAHRAGFEGGQRLEPAAVAGRVTAAGLVRRLHGCFAAHCTGRSCSPRLPAAAAAARLGPAAACCCGALQWWDGRGGCRARAGGTWSWHVIGAWGWGALMCVRCGCTIRC